MKTSTVNIAFKDDLLKDIDHIAKQESRSRSELIREAARMYIDKKKKWESIFKFGNKHAKKIKIKETDIEKEIQKYRQIKNHS
ncbi:MAG: ribbon-helix-helix domain-containing protein [Spirochaetia bacterium]|nr:ribbon-helix-helix domain-containing protein [Spirochaetia bacterium]